MAKDIFDAVYGCLVAGAIGDALGAHVEGWYWTEIRGQQEASGGSYSSHPRICASARRRTRITFHAFWRRSLGAEWRILNAFRTRL